MAVLGCRSPLLVIIIIIIIIMVMVPLYQSLLLIDPFVWLFVLFFVLLLCVVFCLCGFCGVTLSLFQ